MNELLFGAPRPVSSEPWASSPAARRTMMGNRRRDTKPEMAVRRLLHARGLRYRVDTRPLADMRRRADVVFAKQQVAVFIDGCFWHGCPEHGTRPSVNSSYWRTKIAANQRRDADTNQRLVSAGWLPLRYWEHEDPVLVASRIEALVRLGRRHSSTAPNCERARRGDK